MSLGDLLPPVGAAYGEELRFATGARLTYPDFGVEFLGTTRNLPTTSWRFEIRTDEDAIDVVNETGAVRDSAVFEIAGRRFALDLRQLGSDDPWTLVVAPVTPAR